MLFSKFFVLDFPQVPIVILKTKDMRNSTNIFLTNLSIADLLVLLVCTPTVLVEVNTRPETWVLGHEMCKCFIVIFPTIWLLFSISKSSTPRCLSNTDAWHNECFWQVVFLLVWPIYSWSWTLFIVWTLFLTFDWIDSEHKQISNGVRLVCAFMDVGPSKFVDCVWIF